MYRIKIHGAGSIGNHVAHAARQLGWDVTVCDVQAEALKRMRQDVYPKRYGSWDDSIQLCLSDAAPQGGFDVIHIGTPPELHLPLALEALDEQPRAVLVEKPLCPPDLDGADRLWETARSSKTRVFVGFDHVVGRATRKVEELLAAGVIGQVKTLDVEFREHWGGIFAAHWWLNGPQDSYLGFSNRGGGASGEHSHATNLWQHFARCAGAGRVRDVNATLQIVRDERACYDEICLLQLVTQSGLCGRVVQDVVTRPARKRAWIQGSDGAITWINNHTPESDAVILSTDSGEDELLAFSKTRPDDFVEELRHIQAQLESGREGESGIDLERGLDTSLVIAAAHLSHQQGCRVAIDAARHYRPAALIPQSNNHTKAAEPVLRELGPAGSRGVRKAA